MEDKREITVGEFIEHLKRCDPDKILFFGGLDFVRLKERSPNIVQCEFRQQVYPDLSTGKIIIENT